jgi:hypothetical protein
VRRALQRNLSRMQAEQPTVVIDVGRPPLPPSVALARLPAARRVQSTMTLAAAERAPAPTPNPKIAAADGAMLLDALSLEVGTNV